MTDSHRIFFWRYLAWGAMLVLAFGPYVGLAAMVLAYWPVLRSAKRTARRLDQAVEHQVELLARLRGLRDVPPVPVEHARDWHFERRGDALIRVFHRD